MWVVTVAGTVPNAEKLAMIDNLAKEIKGVNAVKLNVKVAPATQ
jgi:osmotically-inducible protein OsmY